jgi:hypothetical protein
MQREEDEMQGERERCRQKRDLRDGVSGLAYVLESSWPVDDN